MGESYAGPETFHFHMNSLHKCNGACAREILTFGLKSTYFFEHAFK